MLFLACEYARQANDCVLFCSGPVPVMEEIAKVQPGKQSRSASHSPTPVQHEDLLTGSPN